MSTFSSANITDGNLVLKERTHRIKIKYSMHQYSIRLHNLGNWLMQMTNLNVFVVLMILMCLFRYSDQPLRHSSTTRAILEHKRKRDQSNYVFFSDINL